MIGGEAMAVEQQPPARWGSTRSELSGSAADVVQARDVSGGIHFHHVPTERRVPRELPRDVRGFVGREPELTRLDTFLDGSAGGPPEIVVITGTAGVGKTSLAVHWAHRVRARFRGGQLYANLRGYGPESPASPAEVLERFLYSLDVPAALIPPQTEERSALFRSLLAGRRVLVILDNAATAGQVRPLLPAAPGCLVVVTSRSRLSGLVARDGAHRLALDTLSQEESVDLVRATTDGHCPLLSNLTELVELVTLCARLPLALRIAAERAASGPHHRLADIISDLRSESSVWHVLSADDGDDGDGGDSVHAVFAWSYSALPSPAARLFRLLGLHPGSDFTADSAAALAGQSTAATRRLLDLLVGAHLIQQNAPHRYLFHDLLRTYAMDTAHTEEPVEDRRQALHRVLSWYLHTAAAAVAVVQDLQPALPLAPCPPDVVPLTFHDREAAMAWYQSERDNFLAVTRAAGENGHDRVAWQLPAVLHGIHSEGHPFDDWFAIGDLALEAATRAGDRRGEALIHSTLGAACQKVNRMQGARPGEALSHHQAALEIFRELGDRQGEGRSTNSIGVIHLAQHELEQARDHFERLLALSQEIADETWAAIALANLASTHNKLGEPRVAAEYATRALACHKALDRDSSAYIDPLVDLSIAHRAMGLPDESLEFAGRACTIARDLGNPVVYGYVLLELGGAQRAVGRHREALATYRESASIHAELGDRAREALALDAAGETLQQCGEFAEAARCHRTASLIHREIGNKWLLATALENLAGALDGAGEPSGADELRQEAAGLVAQFDSR
jgi:tetratricopeptide (TPR) repeat protein